MVFVGEAARRRAPPPVTGSACQASGARGRHSITRAATGRSVQVRAMKTYVIWEVGSGHGDILQEKALVASGSEPGQEKLKIAGCGRSSLPDSLTRPRLGWACPASTDRLIMPLECRCGSGPSSSFVLDGREIAERAVQPLAVVEDLDELEDGPAGLDTRRPGLAVDELLFQCREPAFGHGVVPALAGSRERLGDVVFA